MRKRLISLLFVTSVLVPVFAPAADQQPLKKEEIDYNVLAKRLAYFAEKGDDRAQVELGVLYHSGKGVEKSPEKAAALFRKAAAKGNVLAQVNLGKMHAVGEGVPLDEKEAARWFGIAAEKGNAEAQFSLGLAHVLGKGVPRDAARGIMWLSLSAGQGNKWAQSLKNQVSAQSAKEEVETGEKMADDWKKKRVKGKKG